MVQIVKHDLEFILRQIKIAEAHSAGTPLNEIRFDANGNLTTDTSFPLAVPTTLSPYGLRTVDGSYNNLVEGRDQWGAADNPFPRITDPYYRNETDDSITFGAGSPGQVVFTDGNYGEMGAPPPASQGLGGGTVVDADPRLISNLIVDQTLENPAAIYAALLHNGVTGAAITPAMTEIRSAYALVKAAAPADKPAAETALDVILAKHGIEMNGNSVVIPNVAPDEGLSAPYNSWFTLFGQFFDHGLDLVPKGGNGTIYIPLQPDDPLYNPNSPHTNFMVLTRAPVGATNLTTPWVDQNQTYTSHSSHQLFLREYTMVDGKPFATGNLLEGVRGLATWADVKKQAAEKLGVLLTDADVTNIPLFVMDEYGEFVRGPNGFPQLVTSLGLDGKFGGGDDSFLEGNPAAPISTAGAIRTGHAFLDDIAHAAVPVIAGGVLQQDGDEAVGYKNADGTAGPLNTRGTQTAYDNELLDAHYITGDGRGNENIGLSAVHHVFHSEHNHMVEQVKAEALASGDIAFLNEWLLVDVNALPTTPEAIAALRWDGERLFQAARFTTEMQYQHLVFEEFARKAQPDVDVFVFNPSVDINPAIFAEFAHVVYRFGHSMLRETVDRTYTDGTKGNLDLFDAFLNPLAFGGVQLNADGTPILDAQGNQIVLDHNAAAGAIVRGMTGQVGNEIDEFVTNVLRNELVGIPLDLAALNIARGRDTGIPPLNEARRQFKEMANGDSQLDPYTSWNDFALNLKNPASIVNFIAAYGTHATVTSATTMAAKRDAAMKLVFGDTSLDEEDRQAFLNGTGIYQNKLGGLEDVDLWVGGMAEKKMAFGGMLGSTFSFVFELQMENLQNADRFYYLSRVQGLNFLNELENNSFAKMVMNNTDLAETGYALPGDIFSTPDHVLYMERAVGAKFGYTDPVQEDPWLQALSPMIERRDANSDGVDEYIRVNTNDHVLVQGTMGNDTIIAGGGDDSVWGRDGNDRIEAGYGVDKIHGGKGDDIITNSGTDIGEVDMFHGEEGNDVIHAGSGLALVFGNQGSDFIITGPDGKEAFGGLDNDFILGGEGGDFLLGNEGDDWIEAGNGFDTTAGDNSELLFNSSIIGHDVMFAGQNEHDFDAESGDDIMVQGESVMRNEGMWGFDWAIHKGNTEAADSDLTKPIFTTDEDDILRDRFDTVEALSGWDKNDVLKGDNRGDPDPNEEPEIGENPNLAAAENTMVKHELSQAGVNRIAGMRDLLGNWAAAPVAGNLETQIAFDDGNILLGGGGSDTIEGRGGNDLIDGDRWLNVRIRIEHNGVTYSAEGMTGKVYLQSDVLQGVVKAGAVAQFGGMTLDALMLERALNPGQLSIVREVVRDDGIGDIDTAVFWDVRANYTITRSSDGAILVSHTGFDPANLPAGVDTRVSDGVDKLRNIERLSFADGVVNLTPPDLKLNAFDPAGTVADNFNIAAYTNSTGTRAWGGSWVETGDDGSATATDGQIQITNGELRFDTGDGARIDRNVNLAGVSTARLSYSADPSQLDNGELVRVFFSADGVNFTLLEEIGGNGFETNRAFDLVGPFTANAMIRFEATGIAGFNEFVDINNLAIDVTVPAASPSVNYETTFTEDGAAVTIASLPSITDDAPQMASARIVLTNAQPGDDFDIGSLAGTGISAATTNVAGQIILTLTGLASPSVYQRVIQSITFNNTSENPSTVDRIIEVTVNDGFMDSNVATTTVNVVAVNDAPSAGTDRIVTNFVNAESFTLPDWVFLNNDSDAESAPLSISGVSAGTNLTVTRSGGSITITDIGTTNGGSFTYTVGDGQASATGTVNVVRDTTAPINGGNGSDILVGNSASSTLEGGLGNDLVFAGAGNDTVNWGAGSFFGFNFDDGRDFVDGGEGTLDRFVVNGSNAAETFVVYAKAEAIAAGIAGLKADTEIVITRNGSVIAELDNIEEITINTGVGNDTVQAVGNFNPTSLNFSTITINGDGGDDTVDISGLQSAHRIVFRSNGGNDTIVGTLRAEDVIELAPSLTEADYTTTVEDGITTLTSASHTIRYTGTVKPVIQECTELPPAPSQNQGPVAVVDSATVRKGEVLTLTAAALLANDTDADGGTLSILKVDEDEHGTVVLNEDDTITFTPEPGFTGVASFKYVVKDGQGGYAQGTVAVTVEEAPSEEQPPVD
ncbi:peroxidase family protein, partial [Microvirga aerophila]|uniref:peroxidase family protein n=1 Tax=Microvirga aerophila TaxID=670291 RepID=UPI001478FC51